MMLRRAALLALLPAGLLPVSVAAQDAPLRSLAGPGGVGLLRHALAPGVGDPPGMRLDDCATQRNLSDVGRAQARAAGLRLRAAVPGMVRVYAGAWCRVRETAALLGIGPVEHLAALDSFFAGQGDGARQTAALEAFLVAGRDGPPRILVTHQVNVTALTAIVPDDAEMVVLWPAATGYGVVGRVRFG